MTERLTVLNWVLVKLVFLRAVKQLLLNWLGLYHLTAMLPLVVSLSLSLFCLLYLIFDYVCKWASYLSFRFHLKDRYIYLRFALISLKWIIDLFLFLLELLKYFDWVTLFKNLPTCVVSLAIFIYCCALLGFVSTVVKNAAWTISRILLLNKFDSINDLVRVNWSAYSTVSLFLRRLIRTRQFNLNYWVSIATDDLMMLNNFIYLLLLNCCTPKHSTCSPKFVL